MALQVILSRPTSLIIQEAAPSTSPVYILNPHDPAILDIHAYKRLSRKTELYYFHLQCREERRQERITRRSLLLAPALPQSSATTATTRIPSLLSPVLSPAETGITTPPSSPAFDKSAFSPSQCFVPSPASVPASASACASPLTPAPATRLLSITDFDIHEKLGQGAFGMVYRATHKVSAVELALKIMPKNKSPFRFVQDEHHAMREIENMHGFVQLYASWHDSVNYYLAMQFVQYGDVKHKVTFGNPIPVGSARVWMAELFVLLGELHTKGLVHRDIKPDNLLIDNKGHIVLADFGLTRDFKYIPYDVHHSDPRAPKVLPTIPYPEGTTPPGFSHQRCGTPQYFAPELHMSQAYSYGVDIWSAGITLFYMLFGRTPFNSVDIKSIGDAVINEPLHFTQEELHCDQFVDARDLLARMLAKDPAQRPSVEEIKAHPFFSTIDWKAMSAHSGPSAWKKPPPPRSRPNTSERAAIPFPYGTPYAHGEDPWTAFTFTSTLLQAKAPSPSPSPSPSALSSVRNFFSRTFTKPAPQPKSSRQATPAPSNVVSSSALRREEGDSIGNLCDGMMTTSRVPKMMDRVRWWWADVVGRK